MEIINVHKEKEAKPLDSKISATTFFLGICFIIFTIYHIKQMYIELLFQALFIC